MKLLEYDFEHVCNIVPVWGSDGFMIKFMPQSRYRNARNLPLNKYGEGPFCKFKIPDRFLVCGVYALTADSDVRYVGECVNLSKRFNIGYGNISPKNCFKGGQETNCRLNNLIYAAILDGALVALWFFPTVEYKSIEITLRQVLRPSWNLI